MMHVGSIVHLKDDPSKTQFYCVVPTPDRTGDVVLLDQDGEYVMVYIDDIVHTPNEEVHPFVRYSQQVANRVKRWGKL
jgi:hypothetical protein